MFQYWNQIVSDDEVHRLVFNFQTLEGVPVFPHTWILSLFCKTTCTIDNAKSNALQHWTGILKSNDIQLHY